MPGSAEPYRSLIGISNSHLPRVYEAVQMGEEAAVLEEYVTGDTLTEILEGGVIPAAAARDLILQICDAAYALHSLGLVHRDIKPDNVIVSGDHAWLIDFDAARRTEQGKEKDTRILGTIGYAPPEQFGLSQTDERSDIYAIGVLYNEMLTGEHPALLLAAAAALVCLYVFLKHQPKEYRGGSTVEYGNVRLLLTFSRRYSEHGDPMEEQSYQLPAGQNAATPSFLMVFGGDDPGAAQAFADQVESFQVTANPRDKAMAMTVFGSSFVEEEGPYWRADLEYSPETGTNDICWYLEMKNGDTIHLEHTHTCSLLPALEFHYEDTPLETLEQIRGVIGEAVAGAEADVMITLFLPPVTYTEPLVLDQHAVTIVGTITEEARTTFTKTVTVPLRNTMFTEFYDTAFVGEGGTGVEAGEALWLTNCSFSGWEIGADARDGSWIMMTACDFTDNTIGFRFDSTRSSGACPTYDHMVFSGNGTGVQVKHIPSQESSISFLNCLFENNGTDVEDPNGLVSAY